MSESISTRWIAWKGQTEEDLREIEHQENLQYFSTLFYDLENIEWAIRDAGRRLP